MDDGKTPDQFHRIYDAIWRNMDREDTLIHHRISWAILLSGGLFAASAVLATGVREAGGPNKDAVCSFFSLLMLVLSCIGIYFSYRTQEGVLAAQSQLEYLKKTYYDFDCKRDGNTFENKHGLPRPFGDPRDHISGTRTAVIFPKLMMLVWGAAAVIELIAATYFATTWIHLKFP